ncbi:hypothetical protein [Frankia sp. CcWB2]
MTERSSDIRGVEPAALSVPPGDVPPGDRPHHPGQPTLDPAIAVPAAGEPAPPGRSPGRAFGARPAAVAGLICAAAMALAGFPLGLLWAATAPHLDLAAALGGHESAFTVQSDIDVRFAQICAVAGVIGGAVACWRVRDAGWPVPVGLAAGGIGGSLIAGWIGHLRRSPQLLHALPKDASPLLTDLVDMKVRAGGLYFVMPVTALVMLLVGLWVTSRARSDAAEDRRGPTAPGYGAGAGAGD